MKKWIVLLALWIVLCIDISQLGIDAVNDIVVDHNQWLQSAWDGKVSNSKDRVEDKEIKILKEAAEQSQAPSLLHGQNQMIQNHFNRPGYKNRKEREE